MTVAGPSLVLPTLSTIFSSSSPPTTLFPQTIVLLHTVREWLPIVLQESERRIIQREKSEESRRAKGKGKAREEGEGQEDVELVEIKKLRALLVKGRKLDGKGSTLELVLKAAHIRSILFSTPTSLSSIPSLVDAYFPRPPPPDQPSSSSSSSSADELKRLATQRKIIQAVFKFVQDFVGTYDGGASDLPSSLASAYSNEEVSKHSNFPWEQLRGWISSWLVKVEGVWDELEQGVGGTREGSTTEGSKQPPPPPSQQHIQQPPSPAKPKPRPPTSAAALPPPPSKPSPSSAAAKRSSTGTSTAAMAPPTKKKPRLSKLGGKTTRNMFGGDDDEDSDEE